MAETKGATAQIKEAGSLSEQELARLKRVPPDFGDKFFARITEGPDAGKVVVDPARAYPRYLKELGVAQDRIDRYWLEIARLIMTEDLAVVFGTPLHLQILKNEDWRLAKYPEGKGEGAAQGDVIKIYERLLKKRGALAAQA